MSILRKYLIENLRKTYNNVSYTYGYETKSKRIANRLEKDHNVDARCISGNFSAEPDGIYLYIKFQIYSTNSQDTTERLKLMRTDSHTIRLLFYFLALDPVSVLVSHHSCIGYA